jgi:hypothetical protein
MSSGYSKGVTFKEALGAPFQMWFGKDNCWKWTFPSAVLSILCVLIWIGTIIISIVIAVNGDDLIQIPGLFAGAFFSSIFSHYTLAYMLKGCRCALTHQ